MGGLTIENNFFILKIEKRNKIIVFDFQKVGAGAQKSGGAAALPAPPPPRSLFSLFFLEQPITELQTRSIKLNLLFKLLYLNSNLALTLGYFNPALNNPARVFL